MVSAAVVGATGYTGIELVRLLTDHPKVKLGLITSRSEAGKKVSAVFPSLRGIVDLTYQDMSQDTLDKLCDYDVVFFATPHGVAMQHAKRLVQNNTKVIDLAADFRLQSLTEFETWYKHTHACPDLLKNAVYGLPEITRDKLKHADVVGNPGCYPTTALLGLKPIIDRQNQQNQRLVDARIIIDAKSGVSGAGRKADLSLSYGETADNFKAYGIAGHRHLPEIQQGVEQLLDSKFELNLRFVPHLVPMIRGMFTTIHLALNEAGNLVDWQNVYENAYANEVFVDVLPQGSLPDTRSVRASNQLRIGIYHDAKQAELTVLVVQDNLVKGAAGQALQSMNVVCKLDETMGLLLTPVVP